MVENCHIGSNIRKLREIKNIKQEALAAAISVSQQRISKIEQSAAIGEETLAQIARAMDVSPVFIRNFSCEPVFASQIEVPFEKQTQAEAQETEASGILEKIIELYERLYEQEKAKGAIILGSRGMPNFPVSSPSGFNYNS